MNGHERELSMADEIEMPTPCANCGGIWDLNSLYGDPRGTCQVVCLSCKREIEDLAEPEGTDQ